MSKWIIKYWAILGGIIAFGIVVSVFLHGNGMDSFQSLVWLHFALLLFHQFEEYSFPGKFKDFYNTNILNKNPITRHPLNEKGILVVNVILAWTMYLGAAICGERLIWLTVGLLGITILNGVLHTLLYFVLWKYNPGLLTGFFMFIPFGLYFINNIKESIKIENLILGSMVFVIGTALIPISIQLTNSTQK